MHPMIPAMQIRIRRQDSMAGHAVAAAVTLVLLGSVARGQGTATLGNNAGIAGTVRDEAGVPIEALISIATQRLNRQVLTGPGGTFQFSNLKTGRYAICATATARNLKPQNEPFVDACQWQDRASLQVSLTPGQTRQGVTVTVKHGHSLKVRVNDSSRQLPKPVGQFGGNHLSIFVTGPSGLAQFVPLVNQDQNGRDHAIVIPYDTVHKLAIRSSTFVLKGWERPGHRRLRRERRASNRTHRTRWG